MPEIILHQWEVSPFCNKARRLLRFKGLAFERRDYNGLLALKAARLTATGKLPVMDYDGERIEDSTGIARFLEQRYPEPSLYPLQPLDRARAELWEDWADEALYWFEVGFRQIDPEARRRTIDLLCAGRPGYEKLAMGMLFPRMYRFKLDAQGLGRLGAEGIQRRFLEHMNRLETVLQRQTWLAGDAAGIADLAVSAQLDEIMRTHSVRERIAACRAVADWKARCDRWGDGADKASAAVA